MTDTKEIVIDVTGQEGGPHPDEQARVDAEQKAFMEQRAKDMAPIIEAETRAREQKINEALAKQKEGKLILDMLKDLNERVAALEAKK